jgi:hypothetical protein
MLNLNGFGLGILSLGLIAFALFLWFRFMNAGKLGGRRWIVWGMLVITIGLATAAFTREPGRIGGAFAVLAILMGSFQLALGVFAGQSTQEPKIKLGEPLPAFSALDHTGQCFEVERLFGKPLMIKFFRGHW